MIDFSSRQLRAFLLVAQHRNFSRAAEALFITPSGLSLLIRELENQLGLRLFDRTTRHVSLTADGAQVLPLARRNLEELEGIVSRMGQAAKEASQSISIGAGTVFASHILPQAIKEFRVHRPEVRIRLFDADIPTVVKRVEEGALDIGLGCVKGSSGIKRIPFCQSSLMVIRPDKEKARLGMTTWSALKGEGMISLPSTRAWQQVIDRQLAHAGVPSKSVMVVNLIETQIALVEAGEGIAIVPSVALPACRKRMVVMSRLINPKVSVDFHQIRNRSKKLPAIASEFMAFLEGYVARWAGRSGIS